MTLTITPLTPTIGAEATGVDLTQLRSEIATRLWRAVVDHIVLVIREQRLTASELIEAVSQFGKPIRGQYSQWNMESHPMIAEVVWEPLGLAAQWHTDHSNLEHPPKASVLYAVTLPRVGGDTRFVNMREAYARLPDEMAQRIRDFRTVNSFDEGISVRAADAAVYGRPVTHPMVRTHPESGAKALYFNPAKSKFIEGMTPKDSKALMQRLLDFAMQPDLVFTHTWRPGDVVIFDNRSALHRSVDNYDPSEFRLLYRVLLEGERPV
jgi:taurine dioxygenase